ncbi:MAG: IS3 family transposase [Sulfitobacter sp.]|nr:IS3 family transposase [Sulfitobacter sp.]
MTKRKKYTKEFKQDAVRLVTEQGYNQSEAARNLGIDRGMLGRWVKEFQEDQSEAFRGNGKLTAEQEELRRLREENRRLKMEREILKKANGLLRERVELRYEFIAQKKKAYPVKMLCRLLGVSRNGFYDYLRRQERDPDPEREEKLEWVKDLAEASDHTYGSRRMAKALQALGYGGTGRYQARSLMREAGVWVRYRRRYRATTNSNHRQPVFENRLERDFSVDAPDHVYAGDITYVWTRQGWLYLAVVIDLYSRKVVGWSMGRRLTSSLVCDALQMALWRRRPPKGQLIHHSDRGVQYASHAFRRLLKAHGIEGSMSRKGDCWDNAVVESFFGSLKSERVHWRSYQSREEARADIVEYITMFYNSRRLHSYLGYQSPDEFERNGRLADAA